ncbi:MAG TPA: PEP-CTERM/exosortase system-associated acyltransferase [Rhodocyclaceae bacterium]|nr:PEP-CTERM/exosortase system-associated acyltransferase [Rhodocyclaceae bacterium]
MFGPFSLGEGFKKYFEVVHATDEATRNCVYRIRHEVYCEDLQYEPLNAEGKESDGFDHHSLHCLLRKSDSAHDLVGCSRLVLAQQDGEDFELPFERVCVDSIDRAIVDPARLPRKRIAEVSRLAVRGPYRKRKNERNTSLSINRDDFGTAEQPRFPYIPVGLYLGTLAIAHRREIDTLFVLTEPRLATHFARIGVKIVPIGSPIEHHGLRLPSVMHVPEIVSELRTFIRPIWTAINEQIDRHAKQSR